MRKFIFLSSFVCLIAGEASSQAAFESVGGTTYDLVNRLTTLSGSFSDSIHTLVQPLDARFVAHFMQDAQRYNTSKGWTGTDNALISLALSNTGEWASPDGFGAIESNRPMGPFYKKKTDFLYYNDRKIFLSLNPILGVQAMYDKADGHTTETKFNLAAGARFRAKYKDFLGLDFSFVSMQEQPSFYYQNINDTRNTLIGGSRHYTKSASHNSYRYVLPTGHLSASLLRNYVSLNIGYDFLKLGDGYRSLMLSDFAGPVGFANIRTRVWKLQYDNLYLKLSPDESIPGDPASYQQPKNKFATSHQLSVNIGKRFNLGLYEMVVFTRNGGYEMGYLNPIIFYRSMERALGSPDKVALGFNAKAILAKGFRMYGQFLLNEFSSKEFFAGNGYMHNKWGAQLGFNYYDAFKVPNLDIQAEMNMIRPYTFQHLDKGNGYIQANFTSNNMPLGDPLGAGFREYIFIAKYRPMDRLAIDAKVMLYRNGVDTGGLNLGDDPSKDYSKNVPSIFGVKMINGPYIDRLVISGHASYMIAPNLYFDLGANYGSLQSGYNAYTQKTLNVFSGIRLNLVPKTYAGL